MVVWKTRFWQFYLFISSVLNDQFEKQKKNYQAIERAFHQVFKHFEVGLKKNLAAPRFFISHFLMFGNCDETLSSVIDINYYSLYIIPVEDMNLHLE